MRTVKVEQRDAVHFFFYTTMRPARRRPCCIACSSGKHIYTYVARVYTYTLTYIYIYTRTPSFFLGEHGLLDLLDRYCDRRSFPPDRRPPPPPCT